MNEHAIIKPSLRDILINAHNICECDSMVFMRTLSSSEIKSIENWRAQESKGKKPWFPLTRGYLARLVFQVECCICIDAYIFITPLLSLIGTYVCRLSTIQSLKKQWTKYLQSYL